VNAVAAATTIVNEGIRRDEVAGLDFGPDRRAFVASAAETEQLDAFDAQVAKVVAAVRERWSNFDPRNAP
jgi:hypothetical protein